MGLTAKSIEDMTDEELAALAGISSSANSTSASDLNTLTDAELEEVALGGAPQPPPVAEQPPQEASQGDLLRGSMTGRAVRGAANLLVGPFQLGANIGDKIYGGGVELGKEAGLIDKDFKQKYSLADDFNAELEAYDKSVRRGQEALGQGSFDAMGLATNIAGGISALPKTAGFLANAAAGGGFGAIMPVTNADDFWTEKSLQTGIGAVGGAAIPVLAAPFKFAWDKISPLLANVSKSTGAAIREATGDKTEQIIAALKADINPFTKGSAGEVAAPAGSAKFSALSKAVDALNPDDAAARIAAQSADTIRALDDIVAKGDEATVFRGDVTTPMREDALASAAANTQTQLGLTRSVAELSEATPYTPIAETAQSVATNLGNVPNAVRNAAGLRGAKAQAEAAARNTTTPYGAKVPPRYAPAQEVLERVDDNIADADVIETLAKSQLQMKQYQLDSMAAYGIEGATANPIVQGIDDMMGTPVVVGNPTVKRMVERMSKDIQSMVKSDGTLDPKALYEYRKNGINATLNDLSGGNPSLDRAVTEAATTIRPMLDEVIDKAAGGGWKAYLKAYEKLSRGVEQGKVAGVLKETFTDPLTPNLVNPRALAKALEAQEDTLARAGVSGNKRNLDEVMNPDQMRTLGAVREDIARTGEFERLATAGRPTGREAMEQETVQGPNALIREIMIANNILRRLSENKQAAVQEEIIKLFKRDPELGYAALAEAIKKAPSADRPALVKLLLEQGSKALKQSAVIADQTTEAAQ